MERSSTNWYGVMAGALLLVIIAPTAVSSYHRARRVGKLHGCAANLSQIWRMDQVYCSQNRLEWMTDTVGKAYWDRSRRVRQFFPEVSVDVFRCPLREGGMDDRVDYLGPAKQIRKLADLDPVGCDEEFNHGSDGEPSGMVLRRAGDVSEVRGTLWTSLIREGSCVP